MRCSAELLIHFQLLKLFAHTPASKVVSMQSFFYRYWTSSLSDSCVIHSFLDVEGFQTWWWNII